MPPLPWMSTHAAMPLPWMSAHAMTLPMMITAMFALLMTFKAVVQLQPTFGSFDQFSIWCHYTSVNPQCWAIQWCQSQQA
jgi:hypothetical protein